jgi:hypothetical protein
MFPRVPQFRFLIIEVRELFLFVRSFVRSLLAVVVFPWEPLFQAFLRVPQVRRFPVCSPVQYVLLVPCSLMMDSRFYQGLVFFLLFQNFESPNFSRTFGLFFYFKNFVLGVPGLPFK